MEAAPHLVLFVYGTLKLGCKSHHRLSDSQFIGLAWTKPLYRMYSCGAYPALVLTENGESVGGELYRVTSDVVALLDEYEGADYKLMPIELIGPPAWGYLFLGDVSILSACGPVWTDS